MGVAITDLTTGLYAHGAIMAALLARHQTGMGQKIDLSLLECQVASLANIGSSYLIGGEVNGEYRTRHPHAQLASTCTYVGRKAMGYPACFGSPIPSF